MDKADVKKAIEHFEYYSNGFHKLSGTYIYVRNVRIKKDIIVADVKLSTDSENGIYEDYKNLEYNREYILLLIDKVNRGV